MHPTTIDCRDRHCIIGAGPSGLALARAFLAAGLPFDVFERHTDLGGLWDIHNPGTPVYEHTHFVSSRKESGFMDFPFPPGADFPRREEIHAYLQAFAWTYGLRKYIHFSSAVQRVEPKEGFWSVTVPGETRLYRSVVCASGMHWTPNWPEIPGTFTGLQRHAQDYRSPEEFKNQRVLIVGAGNSGCDIATEAARNATVAYMSMRRGYHFLPKTIFGKPADIYERENEWIPFRIRQWVFGNLPRICKATLPGMDYRSPPIECWNLNRLSIPTFSLASLTEISVQSQTSRGSTDPPSTSSMGLRSTLITSFMQRDIRPRSRISIRNISSRQVMVSDIS